MTRASAFAREYRRLARAGRIVTHLLAGLLATHAVFLLLDLLPAARAQAARVALIRAWARRLCRILRVTVRVCGAPDAGPTLYVANHVSWLDIPCLLSCLDATFVAKADVARWPLLGAMAHRAGTIFLDRGAPEAAVAAAHRMTWRLARRGNVLVFPEGTTTDGTALRPFHARLLQAAIRTGRPVQPVALRYRDENAPSAVAPFVGDDNLLRHLWALLAEESLVVEITFCPPCPAAGDRRRLAARAQAAIGAVLGLESAGATAERTAVRAARKRRA